MSSSDEEAERGCYVCGSTAFHEEEGLEYCVNGHLRSFSQVAVRDEDDLQDHLGRRNRARREKSEKRKAAKVYRGREAFELFLQAYQFILWKQCYDLIEKQKLPADLWTIVLDLWTLRLSKIISALDEKTENGDTSTEALFTNPETSETGDDGASPVKSRKAWAKGSPKLIESVSLCYLAVVILRLPIGLGDIFRWIDKGDLTYFRAIREVPMDLRQKMPGNYHLALDTTVRPTIDHLQRTATQLASVYINEFGIEFPPLNFHVLLFIYIRRLVLPLDVYPITKKLASLVNYDFTYSATTRGRKQVISFPEAQLISLLIVSVKLSYPFDKDKKQYPRDMTEPAAQRLDWMLWLSDFHQSQGTSSDLPKSALDNLQNGITPMSRRREIDITDQDVFGMNESQLDEYMDWYQRTWVKPHVENEQTPSKEILDMFPLIEMPSEAMLSARNETEEAKEEKVISMRLKAIHSNLKVRSAISDSQVEDSNTEVLRPAETYQLCRWTAGDTGSDSSTSRVSEIEKTFFEAAAEVSGMSLRNLILAVKQTERRIARWLDDKRRDDYWREVDAEGDVDEELQGTTSDDDNFDTMGEDDIEEKDQAPTSNEDMYSDGS